MQPKMSRQFERQLERARNDQMQSVAKQTHRKVAGKALLDRQSAREKSGFYDGTPAVAAVMSMRPTRGLRVRKKWYAGRIIKTIVQHGRERQFHATKGWRSYRA